MEGFSVKEFFVQFLGHELLEKVLGGEKKGGSTSEKKADEGLKANIAGLGVNDEVLFWDACQMALNDSDIKVSKDDFKKIINVLEKLKPRQRAEVINIIGRDEQEVKHTKTIPRDKGKPIIETKTEKKNARGASFILLLSKMSEEEITQFLLASGAKETTMDDVEGILEELEKTIGKRWKTVKRVWKKIGKSDAVVWTNERAGMEHARLAAAIYERRETMTARRRHPLRFW